MLKRLKSDESGLTLIEITIVIVILGLLASFIAPRVLNAPDKAKVAKAKLEISALGKRLRDVCDRSWGLSNGGTEFTSTLASTQPATRKLERTLY